MAAPVHEQFNNLDLAEFYKQAEHAHSWGNRCLAVELGEILIEATFICPADFEDGASYYEDVGDQAIAHLEGLGLLQ